MRLKNILITVDDTDEAVEFYKEIFGLFVSSYSEGNVIMTEGLVLQNRKVFEETVSCEIVPKSNSCVLYFEESDIGDFVRRLNMSKYKIQYVTPLSVNSFGRWVVRFYDLWGNLIEVGEKIKH